MEGKILLLGATGKTGQLTLEEMSRLGQNITIGGRSSSALESLAIEHNVPHIIVDIKNKENLTSIFKDYSVIVNLIGPFSSLGYIPVEAAIAAKTHYLDSSWEQEFINNIGSYHDAAVDSGVAVISGVGVSPGVSDLMVSAGYKEFDQCRSVSIYYVEGMRNRFSYGTLMSAARALKSPSLLFSAGRFASMKAGDKTTKFHFNNKYKKQALISYPSGDAVNIPKYISVDSVECFFGAEALTKTFLILGKIPFAADSIITKAICKISEKFQHLTFFGNSGFAVAVELKGTAKGKESTRCLSLVSEEDPYTVTAKLLAHGAKNLIEQEINAAGITSPGQAFNSAELLKDAGLSLSYPSCGGPG